MEGIRPNVGFLSLGKMADIDGGLKGPFLCGTSNDCNITLHAIIPDNKMEQSV